MISCYRAVTQNLENTSHKVLTICTSREGGSHECSNSVAHKSLKQACNKHTGTWRWIRDQIHRIRKKEVSIITLPSHRRRDKKSKITPLELSQLRALNGQLLRLGMQCLPQLLAPLSLLMGQTPQATVGTIYEVNKSWLGRRLCGHGHHSQSMLIILLLWLLYTDAGSQKAPHNVDSWSSLQTPSCCKAENQTCL